MATYLILNIVFLGLAAVWLAIKKPPVSIKKVAATIGILLVFTAVFDAFLIGLDIYTYDYAKTLNIQLVNVPIEDFFYALMAGLVVPAVWALQRKKENHESKS